MKEYKKYGFFFVIGMICFVAFYPIRGTQAVTKQEEAVAVLRSYGIEQALLSSYTPKELHLLLEKGLEKSFDIPAFCMALQIANGNGSLFEGDGLYQEIKERQRAAEQKLLEEDPDYAALSASAEARAMEDRAAVLIANTHKTNPYTAYLYQQGIRDEDTQGFCPQEILTLGMEAKAYHFDEQQIRTILQGERAAKEEDPTKYQVKEEDWGAAEEAVMASAEARAAEENRRIAEENSTIFRGPTAP